MQFGFELGSLCLPWLERDGFGNNATPIINETAIERQEGINVFDIPVNQALIIAEYFPRMIIRNRFENAYGNGQKLMLNVNVANLRAWQASRIIVQFGNIDSRSKCDSGDPPTTNKQRVKKTRHLVNEIARILEIA